MKKRAQSVLFLAASLASSCAAQTATVTFYPLATTVKQQLEAVALPTGGALSIVGWLFDGNKRVAHISRGQFITLQTAAGEHDFVITLHSKKPGKTLLHLVVENGKHYYVRLSAKNLTPGLLLPLGAIVDLKIEQVSYAEAWKEAAQYKRIDAKRVEPTERADLDTSPSFPSEN